MRVTVMGPLKTLSQVRAWPGACSVLLSCSLSGAPPGVWLPYCLLLPFLFFFPFSFLYPLPFTLSAQDSTLHRPHWQADIPAPL